MGDMVDDFRALREHNKQIRGLKEEKRTRYALMRLKDYNVKRGMDTIVVKLPRGTVTFYPYTGWFCGQKPLGKIKGRGIDNLLNIVEQEIKCHIQDLKIG